MGKWGGNLEKQDVKKKKEIFVTKISTKKKKVLRSYSFSFINFHLCIRLQRLVPANAIYLSITVMNSRTTYTVTSMNVHCSLVYIR